MEIKQILDSIEGAYATNGNADRADFAKVMIGTESADESVQAAVVQTQNSVVDNIRATLGAENASGKAVELPLSQRMAIEYALTIGHNPKAALDARESLKNPIGAENAIRVMDTTPEGPALLGSEGFDATDNRETLYFTIAGAFYKSVQTPWAEAAFPTLTIEPTVNGIIIDKVYSSLYTNITRGTSGVPQLNDYKTPITKNANSGELFAANHNKVVPLVRVDTNDDKFLDTNSAKPVVLKGVKYTTDAIKSDIEIDLLALSQTDESLAHGEYDVYESLSGNVRVSKLYYDIGGKVYTFDSKSISSSIFLLNGGTHSKEMSLNLDSESFTLHAGMTATDGTAIALGLAGTDNKCKLAINVSGRINTQTAKLKIFGNSVVVVSLTDANNDSLPTADVTAMETALADMKLVGYDIEAYRTNSTLRELGDLITTDKVGYHYGARHSSPVSVVLPKNATGTDGDENRSLEEQLASSSLRTLQHAIDTVQEHAETLNSNTHGGTISVQMEGLTSHEMNTFYANEAIDLSTTDTLLRREVEADDDLRSFVAKKLRQYANRMLIESNYKIAFDMNINKKGQKPNIVLLMDDTTLDYITGADGKIDLGRKFGKVTAVGTSLSKKLAGKVYMIFQSDSVSKTSKPDGFGYGFRLYSPEIVTELNRVTTGGAVRVITETPRERHVPIMDIMTEIDITGLDRFGQAGK